MVQTVGTRLLLLLLQLLLLAEGTVGGENGQTFRSPFYFSTFPPFNITLNQPFPISAT
jgi:hypothetical protein